MQLQGTIYIDSVFLLNLVMDLYLLWLTAKAMGRQPACGRVFAGSAIGAAGYCLILCLPGVPYGVKVLLGMAPVAGLMIKTACRTHGWGELLRGMGILFTFSFFLGGFVLFLREKISLFAKHADLAAVLAGAGFAGFVLFGRIAKACRRRRENHFCHVSLLGDEGTVEYTALVDTGNGLVEPFSKKPVAVLDAEEWKKLKIWMKPEKYKIIPYHSIGREKGVLAGYEIDTIKVKGNEGEKHFDKVIIAVSKGKVSGKGSYQMILPPELSA